MWNYNLGLNFENIVAQYGERQALSLENDQVSYNDLNILSNKIANELLLQGFIKGDVLCISSKKLVQTYATIIACWKIGVAHSFFDRFSPWERLEKIFKTCEPKAIVADIDFQSTLNGKCPYPVIALETIGIKGSHNLDKSNLENIPSNSVAYIMFTSGSTGNPNGVAITHESALNFVSWGASEYSITEKDRLTNANSLFFDNSVFDVYTTLLTGACLVPLSRENLRNPKWVVKYLSDQRISYWFSVPSLLIYLLNLHSIDRDSFPDLKQISFGGEGFPKNKLKELFDLLGDRVKFHNVYGPTECTCICSSYQVTRRDFKNSAMDTLAPLGHLSRNFYGLILDENGKQVKDGEVGELCLGGANVALGYYNNPEKSSQKFIQNPFNNRVREILYRTGDLVKIDSRNGYYHFCGRQDHQIKFMGYRIELGEVESALATLDVIKESAVTFGKKNGNDEITCFFVSSSRGNKIKTLLISKIPPYMIPRKFINMDELPKNQNGKVDRQKLATEYYDQGLKHERENH